MLRLARFESFDVSARVSLALPGETSKVYTQPLTALAVTR
jgi:hypothetical protein